MTACLPNRPTEVKNGWDDHRYSTRGSRGDSGRLIYLLPMGWAITVAESMACLSREARNWKAETNRYQIASDHLLHAA